MSATSYVLALALLNEPPGAPVPTLAREEIAAVRGAIARLAVDWELLDEREQRLTRDADLATDLNELRRRRRELADAPPLADARRLPPKAVADEFLNFNRAYRHILERRRALEPDRSAELFEALRETDRLHQTWDAVRDAGCPVYYVAVRRQALKKLRDLVGPAAYFSGQWPPHVPVWRFVEIK